MNDLKSQDELRRCEERERKKADVRARLEAQSSSKTKKRGFLTGERKKKLRVLLRRKAAEELKRQQEVKANERRRVIAERIGAKKNLDRMDEAELKTICKQLHERFKCLECNKWDLEYAVGKKELQIQELSSQVIDMRGKFVKPPLKHVPKYEAKIERMLLNARKEIGFTVTLKSVKKDHTRVDVQKDAKIKEPDWSWKKSMAQGSD